MYSFPLPSTVSSFNSISFFPCNSFSSSFFANPPQTFPLPSTLPSFNSISPLSKFSFISVGFPFLSFPSLIPSFHPFVLPCFPFHSSLLPFIPPFSTFPQSDPPSHPISSPSTPLHLVSLHPIPPCLPPSIPPSFATHSVGSLGCWASKQTCP